MIATASVTNAIVCIFDLQRGHSKTSTSNTLAINFAQAGCRAHKRVFWVFGQYRGKSLPSFTWVDPCVYIREFDRYQKGKKLSEAAARWGVSLNGAHRALADAKAAGYLLLKLMPHLKASSLSELITLQNNWQQDQERQYKAYLARKGA